MSIASEIERIKTNIANAYTEIENKGIVTTKAKNSSNLASTISAIQTGGTGGGSGDEELINSYMSLIDNTLGANCTKLPEGITEIRKYTFNGCTNLALTNLPDTVKRIGQYCFDNCTNLKLTKLPSNLYYLENYCFRYCKSLDITEIGSPTKIDGVTYYMGTYAFQGCTSLKEIKINEGFTSIGNSTFTNCTSLTKVDLPSTTTSVGGSSFANCTSLKTIICRANNAPTCNDYAFTNSTNLEAIYVPDASVSKYQTKEGWYKYSSIIKPLSEYGG